MRKFIDNTFDILELLKNRLPVLHYLILEIAGIALLVVGALALFKKHP
jgi:hypothetical protein